MPEAVDAEKSIVPAPKRGNLLTSVVFGVMLALVLCGLPVFYLVLLGRWDNYIYSYFVGWPQMPPLVSTYAVTLAPRYPSLRRLAPSVTGKLPPSHPLIKRRRS